MAEAAAVTEICQRLDGIPLAIELAASRMASMTASEMRNRLDHRFRLLVGSRQGLERHHTLRHAVAWSYDLLDDAEKALVERCSVFTGGFDLESACAVADSVTTSTAYWICRTHWCASRCWSPTVSGANPVFDAGDDPPIAEERLVVRGADWHVTTRCATRWPGLMTCSTTRKRRSWNDVRCSPVDSTSKVPAR